MSYLRRNNRQAFLRTARRQLALPRPTRNALELGHRARGVAASGLRSHLPPEEWYEPSERSRSGYRVVVRPPGSGFVHVVTAQDVRDRLAELPSRLLAPLQIVQLGRMTAKKRSFPCYGLQWGNAIYLYPLEDTLIEEYGRPPRPAEFHEARLYGGRWVQNGPAWKLVWTEPAIRDFYLNNVLIHELGHVLDSRNSNPRDRERFAEWFAISYGYRPSRRAAKLAAR